MDAMAAAVKTPRVFRTLALAVPALVAGTAPALHAHAFLDHAVPAVGSTVTSAPSTIALTFTEDIEPAFSTIEVSDAKGQKIETKAVEHPASSVLALPLPALGPGDYSVHWKVVSVDTHETEGTFRFHVGAP